MNEHSTTTDELKVTFLAQDEQRAESVARQLATFIGGAQQSIDIATYDFRLSDPMKSIVAEALQERATAGVAIRIAYDADKLDTPDWERGMDPAPTGTGSFVQSLGYPWRRIGGMKLMHQKYLVRDAGLSDAHVWTGSTNLTDNAWTLQENNIVEIGSQSLASAYAHDFTEMWRRGTIEHTGNWDPQVAQVHYAGEQMRIQVLFSPGRGPAIDYEVAHLVARARRRVLICSMLLNSGALLS